VLNLMTTAATKAGEDVKATKRGLARAQNELDSAMDAASESTAKAAHEEATTKDTAASTHEATAKNQQHEAGQKQSDATAEAKHAKKEQESATSYTESAQADVENFKTRISEEEATAAEATKAIADATADETKQKTTIANHREKESASKTKAVKRANRLKKETTEKEGQAKKNVEEAATKQTEKTTKATESSNKSIEKAAKATAADEVAAKEAKAEQWAEQEKTAMNAKAEQAKELKTKATCAAKQAGENEVVRFTLSQDKTVSFEPGWQNFGNGYEGLRLQKQGNFCILSGLIRVDTEKIASGVDRNKVFWEGQMESLIQTGESSGNALEWGGLAMVGSQCRPTSAMKFLANNHAETTTVNMDANGRVSFVSGGSRHGWISLSGITWKASGPVTGKTGGVEINSVEELKNDVVMENGWVAEGLDVYRQGHICIVSGTAVNGQNFVGPFMQLPPSCRPKSDMNFMFAHGKETFVMKVSTKGDVEALNVDDSKAKTISLNNIVISTKEGELLELNAEKGWTAGTSPPRALRQGSFCLLSGAARNEDIREGKHSLLKNSGQPTTLPEWCRPRERIAFSVVQQIGTTTAMARVDVLPTGVVRWVAGDRKKIINLDGIRFDVKATIVKEFSKALLKVSECEA